MSQKPIKILIVGQSPILATGMAEATRLIFGALLDNYPGQYELHQLGLTHSFAVAEPRWPIYPTKGIRCPDGYMKAFESSDLGGEKSFPELVQKIKPDLVLGFNDPQRLLHLCWPSNQRRWKLVLYTNIDGLPFPPGDGPRLNNADLIVTMSDFARKVLLRSVRCIPAEKVHYLYSPADTERFKPVSPAEKAALRKKQFPPWMPLDAFVLGFVGRNQWRKQNWIMYEVIHHLRKGGYLICKDCQRITVPRAINPADLRDGKTCPISGNSDSPSFCRHCRSQNSTIAAPLRNVFLWLHTIDEPSNAWPAQALEEQFDIHRGRDLYYTGNHKIGSWISPSEMPALYNSWDGLLYLSGGEGFGMPLWEAMCCALPSIYTNYSSHAELANRGRAGIAVDGQLQPEPTSCIFRIIADVGQTIAAARMLATEPDTCGSWGKSGRTYACRFSPPCIASSWHKWLQNVVGREITNFAPPQPVCVL